MSLLEAFDKSFMYKRKNKVLHTDPCCLRQLTLHKVELRSFIEAYCFFRKDMI